MYKSIKKAYTKFEPFTYNTICICILCVKPDKNNIVVDFLETLPDIYDLYILYDDNNITPPKSNKITFIQIDNNKCKEAGFIHSTSYGKEKNRSISWDKALYYFSYNNKYKYYWLLEEDVFIPHSNTILNIDNKYKNFDLLSATHNINSKKLNNWHWHRIKKEINNTIPLPWFCSMVCGIRISNTLLQIIKNYANKYNKLFFIETMFNTLAHHYNLSIKTPVELSTIVYRKDWNPDNKDYLYHPIKDLNKQKQKRLLFY